MLSPQIFLVYVDDLIKELRLSGYRAHLCNLIVGHKFAYICVK